MPVDTVTKTDHKPEAKPEDTAKTPEKKAEDKPKAVVARKTVAPPVPEDRADPMPETPEQAQALARIKAGETQEPETGDQCNVQILFRQLENRQLECVYVTDGTEAEDYAKEFGGIVVKGVRFDPPRDLSDEDRELPSDRAMRLAKAMEREARHERMKNG